MVVVFGRRGGFLSSPSDREAANNDNCWHEALARYHEWDPSKINDPQFSIDKFGITFHRHP